MAAFVWAAAVAGNWSVGANWQVGGVPQAAPPTSSDTVTFGSGTGATQSNCTVDVTANCSTIIFTGYTGTFNYSGQTLNVSGATCTFVSGMTVTSNSSSVITLSGASVAFSGGTKSFSGLVSFTGSGTPSIGNINTFVNLTRTGTAVKTDGLQINANQTVTGTLTMGGNTTRGVNRLLVNSQTATAIRTITMTGAAVVISGDVDFQNLTISGSPSWTNAGSAYVGDGYGNSSLITTNRTTPATQTATGTSSFTWSTHGWTSRVPLPQDNVSIPNAFAASQTVTLDMPRAGATIDFTGATGSPVFATTVATSIYGSFKFVSGMTASGTNTLNFLGQSTHTITSAGVTFTQPFAFNGPGGTYTLQDNFTCSRSALPCVTVTSGTLADNGKTVTLSAATSGLSIGTNGTLDFTGSWNIADTAAGNFWSSSGSVTSGTGTITLTAASANSRTFGGGGNTYGTLTYTVAGSTGALVIGNSNTFNTLNFSDATNARTLTFNASTTNTFTRFNVIGTAGKLMTINSATPGTAATISSAASVGIDYVSIQDSTASGGTPFYAGSHSTLVSNTTNWLASDPVISPTGISSGSTLGSPTVTPGAVTIATTGVSSTTALGSPTVTPGAIARTITGITSGSSLGSPYVRTVQYINPASITYTATSRSYYIDSNGNVFWVINQGLGLVERI